MSIFENLEILTVTFKSEHIIESCLSQIDTNFKITIVENSDNLDFKKKMEERKTQVPVGRCFVFLVCNAFVQCVTVNN